jgi:hypothetical protein
MKMDFDVIALRQCYGSLDDVEHRMLDFPGLPEP